MFLKLALQSNKQYTQKEEWLDYKEIQISYECKGDYIYIAGTVMM
jgi:hypothetical protein